MKSGKNKLVMPINQIKTSDMVFLHDVAMHVNRIECRNVAIMHTLR